MSTKRISPRLKLERAEKHIRELKGGWNKLQSQSPYGVLREDHPNEHERSWTLMRLPELPEDFSLIVGDIFQNLRSALDHLIVLAISNKTGNPPVKRLTTFPIGQDATEFPAPGFGGRVVGLGKPGIEIIERLHAYKGGNEAFWLLHSLNNLDKHNLVIIASNALTGHTIPDSIERDAIAGFLASYPNADRVPDLRGTTIRPRSTPFPLQQGSELLRLPISELKENMEFTFDIAFNQPGRDFHGLGVFRTIQDAYFVVFNAIEQFESAGLV